ncbi:hypothetical protein CCACVL1_24178 [Corchorus capsularis]|uniref:Uncharacterized protein n=1 Tax=Corchorus capsularis TaxID=210143 RepID=A0A1R3GQT8_COCAP|nr:hypothetical protein CCACVL1_24178 [Corchorus capsularis]
MESGNVKSVLWNFQRLKAVGRKEFEDMGMGMGMEMEVLIVAQ